MESELTSVCFISQAFPDNEKAYRGIFIRNLAKRLGENGFRVVVVTPRIFNWSRKREHVGNVEVFRFVFPSGGKLLISYRRIPVFRMILYLFSCAARTCTVMVTHSCQLIHVHWIHPNGIIGVLVKALFRKPLIVHVRGSDFNLFATRDSFFRALTRIILRQADRVLCTSESSRAGLLEAFPRLNRDKFLVTYNSVDASQFHPIPEGEARRMLGIPTGLHFLFVGNLVREKGVLELIDAVRHLPESLRGKATLHIIGSGPLEKDLSVQSDGRLWVYHRAVPHPRIPLYLNAANLLILPSDREGTPNVVLEALSCGTPVLATRVGDIPRLIREGENGFLIDRRNKREQLVEFLRRTLESPEKLIAMKEHMRRNAALRMPWEKYVSVEQIYASLLKGRARA